MDSSSGLVLEYDPDGNDPEYADIVKVDIPEYVIYNGRMDDTDICLIGFWTITGQYEPPCHEDRELRGETITARYQDALRNKDDYQD